MGAIAVVLGALLSLPVLDNPWRWYGVLFVPLVFVAGLSSWEAWQDSTIPSWARTTGLAVAGVLLASFTVGLATQVSADGKPYLTGTTAAVSLQLADDLAADRDTLLAQQTLLQIPPEQARTLHPELDDATASALAIAERRNPALQTDLPLPDLYTAFELTSYAAAVQAKGLEAQKANSLDPEPSLAATVIQANRELDVLLGSGPGSIEEKLSSIRSQATEGRAE